MSPRSRKEAVTPSVQSAEARRPVKERADVAHRQIHAAVRLPGSFEEPLRHQPRDRAVDLDEPHVVANDFPSLCDDTSFALSPADDDETALYERLGTAVSLRELVSSNT